MRAFLVRRGRDSAGTRFYSGRPFSRWLLACLLLLSLAPASAQETINYTYDARGRLVKVDHGTTGPNANVVASYVYDDADNRCNVTVSTTGAAGTGSCSTGGTTTITLSPTTLPNGTVSTAYSQTITASGGTSPYTFAVTAGALPAGLTLNGTTGVLSGTPTAAGTSSFTVTATDSASHTGNQPYSVTIGTQATTCSGVSFSIADATAVDEGTSLKFKVSKTGTTTDSCTVNYATANGTAKAGTNYTAKSGTLTFASNTIGVTFSVLTQDDGVVANPLTMFVNISGPSGAATITDSQGMGTINNIDGSTSTCTGVAFTIKSNAAVTEGTNSVFTITKTGTATGSCSVNYATASGTATAGSDFTTTSGTLAFTSAQTSQMVSVPTINDTVVENAETFSMALSSPTGGATLGTPSSATATINDNDGGGATCSGVSYAISDASGTEGDTLVFTVTKTGTTSSSCSVGYATADGTAIAGTNYVAASGTLTFASTQPSSTISVTTIDQSRAKGTQTFNVNLSSPTGGATITDSQGIGSLAASGGGIICTPFCP